MRDKWIVVCVLLACVVACGGDNNAGPTAPTAPTAPTNRAPVAVGQIPGQIVNVGESVTLDVAQYFNDPDGDTLTYSATSSNVAAVSVEASIVTITTATTTTASGSDNVTVSASDGQVRVAELTFLVYVHFQDQPPYTGGSSAYIEANILTSADPTSLRGVTYAGREERLIFNPARNEWFTLSAYLFDVRYGNVDIEYLVNTELGNREAARAQVDMYAGALGRIPAVLLSKLQWVLIFAGSHPISANVAGPDPRIPGSEGRIFIPAQFGADLIHRGWIEEVFIHEGAHVSLDNDHLYAPGWRAAQVMDRGFISDYARDFPNHEDVAESIMPWFALRYFPERLSNIDRLKIRAAIPNRLAYFDEQGFDMSPYRRAMAPVRELVPFQPLQPQRWRPFEGPPLRRRNR
ncbi:MAG: hypothetical protein F4Y14_01365 [Acidobacteria bacterium]|nr:hypothetical protein [Acidobacteriota bacterium]